MKPIIQKIWIFIAMLWISSGASAYDFKIGGIAYTITSFSELTCAVVASNTLYEGTLDIPSEVMFNGKTLTVTSISNGAFKNSKVVSIQIPASVVNIEASAFAGCNTLNSIGLSEGLQSIGNNAFNGCAHLSNIDFPSSLNTIGSASFANCESLTKVSLANISTLEANVFKGCINLSEIEWNNKIQRINDYAFANCGFTSFSIPNTVTNIGENILLGNKNLKSITIGNGISEITSDPIAGCPNVTELIIADGTNPLTLDFSSANESLIGIDNNSNKYYYTRPGAYSASTFDYVYIGRTLSNPSNSISNACYYTLPPFHGNKTIKNITIGPDVSTVESVIFSCNYQPYYYGWLEDCSKLESLTIKGLTEISNRFAKDAISLKKVELPIATKKINENAFYNCKALESIIFGSKLSYIGANALDNCDSLKSIYCKSKTPPTYSTGFNKDIYFNCQLNIPPESEQAYKDASPWNNFWNLQENQECVGEFKIDSIVYTVSEGNNVFISGNVIAEACSLVIPSLVEYNGTEYNVTGIGENAFRGSTYLESIVIPGSITNIYNDAFYKCSKLKKVVIEQSDNTLTLGYTTGLHLPGSITPYPNATDVDQRRTGFCNGYYDGLFYGLPIEHLAINRNVEIPTYYERTVGKATGYYTTVYNDIIYYPPFYGLNKLEYLEIGESVSSICKNKIEAVVNAVPTTMVYTNFGKCDNIAAVVSSNPSAPIGGGFSQTVYENASLFLPNGGEESYKNDDYWKRFSNIINSPFIAIESISFENEDIVLDRDETRTLTPIINPANASIKKLKWNSNSSRVAVTDEGVITSSTWYDDEATITASACDGSGVSASIKVIVKEGSSFIPVKSIIFEDTELTMDFNETQTLQPRIEPNEASNKDFKWKSSNAYIVEVSDDGVISSFSRNGTSTITATARNGSGISASIKIIVKEGSSIIPARSITLNQTNISIKRNETYQLEATVSPDNTTDKTVTWSSSDDRIAKVSDTGIVTGVSAGEAVIKSSCGDISAECKVSVSETTGIEEIATSPDSRFDVYNINGIMIKKGCTVDDLHRLPKGIYIVVSESKRYKISI